MQQKTFRQPKKQNRKFILGMVYRLVIKHLIVLEKNADRLSVVNTTDRLGKNATNLQNLEFWASSLVLLLWNRVGNNDLVNSRGIKAGQGISGEDTVGDQRIDIGSTLALDKLGSTGDSVAGISQIIDDDGNTACNISDKHHSGILAIGDACWATLLDIILVIALGTGFKPHRKLAYLVDKSEVHLQAVCNSSSTLGSTGVWRDDDSILEIWDVLLDVALKKWLSVEVVDWNIEEALILWVVEVHGNNVVGSGAGQEVSNKGSSLSNPLLVSWLWLEELRTGDSGWVLVVVSSKVWSRNTGLLSAVLALSGVRASWWGNSIGEVV